MPIEILMPALSPTMTDGTLAKWLKKEGDTITSGDIIAEIETDKATMEVEAVDEGILGKIIVPDNSDNVPVNNVIALILEDGEDNSAIDKYNISTPEIVEQKPEVDNDDDVGEKKSSSESIKPQAVIQQQSTKAPIPPSASLSSVNRSLKASPLANKLAKESGINIESVIGTGSAGRIVKADIEDAIASGGTSAIVRRNIGEFTTIPNSNMRKIVGKRLLESKQQIPHFYLTIDCELDSLIETRKQLNDKAASNAGKGNKPAYKTSVNDFIIKAVALALKDVPEANASWYDDAIVQYSNVDVSVAVAIDGGLITPIVKNADQKPLPAISNEVKSLVVKAKNNSLKPEEYQGGGFSISNLGMYGIKEFAAIVNPPQACILAVGKGAERAVVKNGKLAVATVMTVTLSVDHRAVDGAVGATFLEAFKNYIEQPITMFV